MSVCMYVQGASERVELNQMGQVSESADHVRESSQVGMKSTFFSTSSTKDSTFVFRGLGLLIDNQLDD
jgi:hypothetical protein